MSLARNKTEQTSASVIVTTRNAIATLAGEDSVDEESERSYDGSDADYYYELKDEREERKRELLQRRREIQQKLEFEKSKKDEVNAAYKSFKKASRRAIKKGRTISIDSIVGQSFNLFSSDHVERFYYDTLYGSKYIDFYYLDEDVDKRRLAKR